MFRVVIRTMEGAPGGDVHIVAGGSWRCHVIVTLVVIVPVMVIHWGHG